MLARFGLEKALPPESNSKISRVPVKYMRVPAKYPRDGARIATFLVPGNAADRTVLVLVRFAQLENVELLESGLQIDDQHLVSARRDQVRLELVVLDRVDRSLFEWNN